MNQISKLWMKLVLISFVISFVSFGIVFIGGPIDGLILVVFCYLGLTGIFAMLIISMVIGMVFAVNFVATGFQQVHLHGSGGI